MNSGQMPKSKCPKCRTIFRKGQQSMLGARVITSRQDAKDFYSKFNFFVQENDVICAKCYTSFRAARSRQLKNNSEKNSETSSSSVGPQKLDGNASSTTSKSSTSTICALAEKSSAKKTDKVQPSDVSKVGSQSSSSESSSQNTQSQVSTSSEYLPDEKLPPKLGRSKFQMKELNL